MNQKKKKDKKDPKIKSQVVQESIGKNKNI